MLVAGVRVASFVAVRRDCLTAAPPRSIFSDKLPQRARIWLFFWLFVHFLAIGSLRARFASNLTISAHPSLHSLLLRRALGGAGWLVATYTHRLKHNGFSTNPWPGMSQFLGCVTILVSSLLMLFGRRGVDEFEELN